jgi:hypothetical protein
MLRGRPLTNRPAGRTENPAYRGLAGLAHHAVEFQVLTAERVQRQHHIRDSPFLGDSDLLGGRQPPGPFSSKNETAVSRMDGSRLNQVGSRFWSVHQCRKTRGRIRCGRGSGRGRRPSPREGSHDRPEPRGSGGGSHTSRCVTGGHEHQRARGGTRGRGNAGIAATARRGSYAFSVSDDIIDPTYLPFRPSQLRGHFCAIRGGENQDADRHLKLLSRIRSCGC